MIKIQKLLLETNYLSTKQQQEEQPHHNEKESSNNRNLQMIWICQFNGNERPPIITHTDCWTLKLRLEENLELSLVKIRVVEFMTKVLA